MPRVSQEIIDSVFYLYANRQDAVDGKSPCGTGFVVAINVVRYQKNFIFHYGVTNWHVACQGGFSVVRLNKKDGSTDVLEFGPEDWNFIAGRQDIAVVPLELDRKVHKIGGVNDYLFMGRKGLSGLGVGEDVFMLGLFIDHAGKATNIPSARFGNISMLPSPEATIEQPTTYDGESFVLDLRSRTGYSGSPVFIYRTPLADLSDSSTRLPARVDAGYIAHQLSDSGFEPDAHRSHSVDVELELPRTMFNLLGIHWGQFPEKWEISNPELISESDRSSFIPKRAYVSGLSGMTCVIPAWEIMEVINMPKLQSLRNEIIKTRSA